tara:strand:+ start:877 stop:1209 length:333 start_codon:yes stop_codon:yes gene_type:complete
MVVLIVFAFSVLGFLTYAVIRLSVSCMFWSAKNIENKMQVFKIYFPYYIICLFALCITAIIGLQNNTFVIYYFSSVFFISLFVWHCKIKNPSTLKKTTDTIIKPQYPNLP